MASAPSYNSGAIVHSRGLNFSTDILTLEFLNPSDNGTIILAPTSINQYGVVIKATDKFTLYPAFGIGDPSGYGFIDIVFE